MKQEILNIQCNTKKKGSEVDHACNWDIDLTTFSEEQILEGFKKSIAITLQARFRSEKNPIDATGTFTASDFQQRKVKDKSKDAAAYIKQQLAAGLTIDDIMAQLEIEGE